MLMQNQPVPPSQMNGNPSQQQPGGAGMPQYMQQINPPATQNQMLQNQILAQQKSMQPNQFSSQMPSQPKMSLQQ